MTPEVRRTFKAKTGATLTLLAGGLDDSPEQTRAQGPPMLPEAWLKVQVTFLREQRARRELAAKKAKASPRPPQASAVLPDKVLPRAKSRAQVYFMRRQLERLRQGLPLEIKGHMSAEDIQAMAETPLEGLPERVSAGARGLKGRGRGEAL